MLLPAWVFPGAKCECTDDHWEDTFQIGTSGPHPQKGDRFTIAGSYEFLGVGYLILDDSDVSPDYYAASAFRPLLPEEGEEWGLRCDVKGAAAAAARVPVHAS